MIDAVFRRREPRLHTSPTPLCHDPGAMIPVRVDPATGARVVASLSLLLASPRCCVVLKLSSSPQDHTHYSRRSARSSRASSRPSRLRLRAYSSTRIRLHHRQPRPVELRQPDFDNADDGSVDIDTSSYLSAKTLTALKTKLALSEINDYVIDLVDTRTPCRRQVDGHSLVLTDRQTCYIGLTTTVNPVC